jgi:hypothetical protein
MSPSVLIWLMRSTVASTINEGIAISNTYRETHSHLEGMKARSTVKFFLMLSVPANTSKDLFYLFFP